MNDPITTTLPTFIPSVNLALSVIVLTLMAVMTWHAYAAHARTSVKLLHVAMLVGALVHVCGAGFQAGIIGVGSWAWIGSGGRVIIFIIVLALVLTPDALRVERNRGGEHNG